MTSLVPAATPRLQAGQGETTRPSTENTGQLGKEAPISDAQALGVVVCCAAAMPVPSPADRRRRCPGPCPCRQLGGGGCPVSDVGCLACVRRGLGLSHSRSRRCWLTAAEVTSAAGVGGVASGPSVCSAGHVVGGRPVDVVAVLCKLRRAGGDADSGRARPAITSIKIVQPGRSEKGTWTWKVVRWAGLACGGTTA